jgi:hypothetical protein
LTGADVQFLVDRLEDAFAVFRFEVVGAEFDTNHNADILTIWVFKTNQVLKFVSKLERSCSAPLFRLFR